MDKPSKIQMAQNLGKDIAQEAIQTWMGKDAISQYEKDRRLKICSGCIYWKEDSMRCQSCGCFMKIKAGFRSVKCPIGKW
jgi:hypothetical protein